MQRRPPGTLIPHASQPTTILFERKRQLEEAKDGLSAQKKLSEEQKIEFEKRREEIKLRREQLIQQPAMRDNYVKQNYDKIAQAEQLFLTEQAACKSLDQEIQQKQKRITQLEQQKTKKDQVLREMEKQRDYLVREETDEYPEVIALIQRYEALRATTKELGSQIEGISRQQEDINTEITRTKQDLNSAMLQKTNQLDQLEQRLKGRRQQMRNMIEGIQSEVVQLTQLKTEESEVKMALANLFTRVVYARVNMAGTLSAPAICKAQTSQSAPLSPLEKYFVSTTTTYNPLIQYLAGEQPSQFGNEAQVILQQQAQLQVLQQQQHEADVILAMMQEQYGAKDRQQQQLLLIRDFLSDLMAIESSIDSSLALKYPHLFQVGSTSQIAQGELTTKQADAPSKAIADTKATAPKPKPTTKAGASKGDERGATGRLRKGANSDQGMGEEAFWGTGE
ncbi:MAG: hypothetical protein EZS28_018814 [Streblomastix strix]|uniref:DUF4200 domain-containing protein n=1 Tax=Streblomastix strix TaxID=222440 RepID=A0A5J4VSU6_9EUKA|nr:MAG: hypothetical protein EZS28_018814 [Streblomastix strix]